MHCLNCFDVLFGCGMEVAREEFDIAVLIDGAIVHVRELTCNQEGNEPFFLRQQLYLHAHRAAHTVRQAYGWDDEQIIDAMEMYGPDWLDEVYQFIIEDQKRELQNLMTMMPLARTAMGKEDGKALRITTSTLPSP